MRIPVIHPVNTDDKNLKAAFEFIKEKLPPAKLELLPFHTLGEGKYKELHIPLPPSDYKTPSKEEIDSWYQMAKSMGIEPISYK